jgi:hypothetical protein
MSLLLEHFKRTQDLLLKEFGVSQQFQSSKILGDVREFFIQEFLESHLPSRFYIGKSGEIIDGYGGHTDELDIIIYSENVPKLSVQGRNMYLREGVSVVIEVKSTLDSCKLQQDIQKTKIIKSLKASPILQSVALYVTREAPIIPVYIFAYQSDITLEKIAEQIKELNLEQRPEFIGILGRGFIRKTPKNTDEGFEIKKNPDIVLAQLFFDILDATSSFCYIKYDWGVYVQ